MTNVTSMLRLLTDAQLLTRVQTSADHERQSTAELVAGLAELEARGLHLGQGYSSLFAYCTDALRLSEDAAYNRIRAVRVAAKWPEVLDMIADGSLSITVVRLLFDVLTDTNHVELLAATAHKSKREVEVIVAAIDPRLDAPARLSRVAPVSAEHYTIHMTISKTTHDKLRRAQDLMRHSNSNGDPALIFDRALTVLLERLEKAKFASTVRPRRQPQPTRPRSRHIPSDVRREVWARDGGRCAFVGTAGRCQETGFLEYHHVVPYAAGGEATSENIQLRCRSHNAYESAVSFGSLPLPERAPSCRSS